MNKYWIDSCTGQKAVIVAKPKSTNIDLSADDADIIWVEHKDDGRTNWALKNAFEKFWLPITKAEYDSDITLREIKAARENDSLEVGGTHYQKPIQVWDFVYANNIPFDEASIIKYVCRHKEKNGAEDIKKAISFCQHILKTQYNEQ